MKFSEYADHDALGLAQLIKSGEVSTDEVEQCARTAIEQRNPDLNAVISTVEGQRYATDAPFTGVPFLVKELVLQAAGAVSRAGSRAVPAIAAEADSTLMARFREAGVHLLGTTQSPEMGYNATTETVAFGPVHNPWGAGHSAGGSSGGSGAAVAAGLVPIAHANDGGGSIRVPASCDGLVGLKPTRDRIPTGPGASDPLFAHAVDFIVSRSVRDSAAMLDCVAGADLGAPHASPLVEQSFAEAAASPPKPMRIAWLPGTMFGTSVHTENAQAVGDAAERLEGLGHTLIDSPIKLDFDEFCDNITPIWCAFAAQFVDQVCTATGCPADDEHFEAITLTCAELGFGTNSVQILNCLDYINRITRETAAAFKYFDLLLSCTLSTPPPVHGTLNQHDATLSAIEWSQNTFRYASNTPLFNSTGQPAISLPMHWSQQDLPVGVQLGAKQGEEGLLLSMATQLEEDCDWRSKQRQLWRDG